MIPTHEIQHGESAIYVYIFYCLVGTKSIHLCYENTGEVVKDCNNKDISYMPNGQCKSIYQIIMMETRNKSHGGSCLAVLCACVKVIL